MLPLIPLGFSCILLDADHGISVFAETHYVNSCKYRKQHFFVYIFSLFGIMLLYSMQGGPSATLSVLNTWNILETFEDKLSDKQFSILIS